MLKKITRKILKDQSSPNMGRNSPDEIISSKPGAVSKWIFPIYTVTLILIFSVVSFIHHPEIVKTEGIITGSNASGDMIWVEAEIQESNIPKIVSGQSVLMHFTDTPSATSGLVQGVLQKVTPTPGNKKILVGVMLKRRLPAEGEKGIPRIKGSKLDLLIIIKDVRLLQHILNRSTRSKKTQ